jgi:hypothetical protein
MDQRIQAVYGLQSGQGFFTSFDGLPELEFAPALALLGEGFLINSGVKCAELSATSDSSK